MKRRIIKDIPSRPFRASPISKNGFLGNDGRPIEDIIHEDNEMLSRIGAGRQSIAERLQYFIEEGKKGLEGWVDLGEYSVQVQWDRGMLPCPFGEPGLHPKIVATIQNKKKKKEISFSQLCVHLILEHGFFGGKKSNFRLEPESLIEILGLRNNTNCGG